MRRVVEIALFTEDAGRMIAFYEQLLEALPLQRWDGGARRSAYLEDPDGRMLELHRAEQPE